MKTSTPIRPVALVGGMRLPFMRMGTKLSSLTLLDLLTLTTKSAVQKFGLTGEVLGDVALGTTFYHPDFWNLSRDVVFKSGLSPLTPAMGVQRACATSLEATISIANKISLGQIECGLAGGAESMSNVALYLKPALASRFVKSSKSHGVLETLKIWGGVKLSDLKPLSPPGVELSTGKSMGQHCEIMAQKWQISREAQDELSLTSHQSGLAAFARGFYKDLVTPLSGEIQDNSLRKDTSLEKLGALKPAFEKPPVGTLTAGNSSPFTDGAAVVLLASEEWAKARGLPVLAYITDFETAAVDIQSEGLLMAPVYAMAKLLSRQNLKLQQFDFYEIHEAFAAQVLCNLKAWEDPEFCRAKLNLAQPLGAIDRSKLNVVGGSVALGHPFGATGARILSSLGKLLSEKGSGRGLASICTGGGMGTVMILERP